ncbi:TraB/GumN family protein [Cyanobium sp. FGCU-52]|nr:TraB/GumN family protein [Cyanobium sp. FGCU52]
MPAVIPARSASATASPCRGATEPRRAGVRLRAAGGLRPALRRTALALALALFGLAGSPAPAAAADGLLWRVRGPVGTLLLAGTLHRLPPGVELPPLYRRWCAQADRLLMEVDPAALELSTLLPLTMERALQPPGGSLETDLGPGLWRRLTDRLAPLGLAPELLRQLRPWAVLLLLSGRELERQGFEATGVDQRLAACAAAAGRPMAGLETAAAQLNLLADLPLNQQRRAIEEALAQPRASGPRLADLAAAWQRGQLARLEALLPETGEAAGDPLERRLRGRHRAWLPRLEQELQRPGVTLVAVGLLHLLGEEGLVSLLRRAGYRVERVGAPSP